MTSEHNAITISVIISTYNRAAYLAQCLDSLLGQSRPPEEIIVVNDGSTDSTPQVAARYTGKIRYFTQENQGKSVALNFAIPRASGSHVVVFDDDDVMLPEALAQHTAFLTTHPDIEYTYSNKYFFNDDKAGGGSIWDEKHWNEGPFAPCPPEELFIKTMEWNGALMQGMVIAKQCFAKTGWFAKALRRSQDYDMMLRLARHCRGACIGHFTFVHRYHKGARGSGAHSHQGEKRHAVWHTYDRQIFSALRAELSLAEYLPLNTDLSPKQALTEEQQFAAVCQRCLIMFKRGLLPEGAEDIRILTRNRVLNKAERARINELIMAGSNINQADLVPGALGLAQGLCAAVRGPRELFILEKGLQGLYWTWLRSWRHRRGRHMLLLTRAMALLAAHRVRLLLPIGSLGKAA
jgi:glycosyltransferase involved in cell wall biosynthesis